MKIGYGRNLYTFCYNNRINVIYFYTIFILKGRQMDCAWIGEGIGYFIVFCILIYGAGCFVISIFEDMD